MNQNPLPQAEAGESYETWLDRIVSDNPMLELGIAIGAISNAQLTVMAYDAGVRKASDRIIQGWLDNSDLITTHQDEPWFREAARLWIEEGDAAAAAKIFVDHDITHSVCCGGANPECELEMAIHMEIASRN